MARRKPSYPTDTNALADVGYAGPQLPSTDGAFAYYPLQEAVGAGALVDPIGTRNLTGGTLTQTPHQLFPGRKMLRAQTAFSSAVDAAWDSGDLTVEAIIYPYTAGTGPTMQILNNATLQENCRIHWANGQIQYQHFGKNSVNPAGNPFYPGTGSIIATALPYLFRLRRDNTAKTLGFYMDGSLQYSDTYAGNPPVGDQYVWGVGSFFLSDVIVWKTKDPSVTPLAQAQRVKPWLF